VSTPDCAALAAAGDPRAPASEGRVPPLDTIRLLLESTAGLADATLAMTTRDGRLLARSGPTPACAGCPGPLGTSCRLFTGDQDAGGDPCTAGLEFMSVAIPGHGGLAADLVAIAERAPEGAARRWSQVEMVRFLHGLAGAIAGIAREHADLDLMSQELSTRYEELNLIYGVSEQLARGGELREVLRYILEESMSTTSGQWALLHLQKRGILEADGRIAETIDPARDERRLPALAATILGGLIANDRQPLAAPPGTGGRVEELLGTPVDLIAAPIVNNGELDGFLAVAQASGSAHFTTSDVRLLQALAEQVALVVNNWELHASLREFLMSTVRSLVSAIDAKDAYTRGHSERVHRLALRIGEELGVEGPEFDALRWASLLHDIGKIGVPEAILSKPGALTEEELEIMRRHPERSCEIISHIAQLAPALDGIRHHHERWDGAGYPARLGAETIPVLARIITVADIFDALTSDRAYREALAPEEVRRYIRGAAGRELDPRVVEAFDAIFPELVELLREAKETTDGNRADPHGAPDADHRLAAAR
jgi:response regulator RpfG family c-di-GMP phosphodiesterase